MDSYIHSCNNLLSHYSNIIIMTVHAVLCIYLIYIPVCLRIAIIIPVNYNVC